MIVVGGTYSERCFDPVVKWTYGSGARAVAVLGEQVDEFITLADSASVEDLRSTVGNVTTRIYDRRQPIRFSYDTPVSRPHIDIVDDDRRVVVDDVEGDDVLTYGMVEANPRVSGRRVIVDPQHSLTIEEIATGFAADDLVVVANLREIRNLSGVDYPVDAARSVVAATGAHAVVVKCGAAGALVFTEAAHIGVPVMPTQTVFPIGSGDVFSAAFAHAYFGGDSLEHAALAASSRTARYCATRQTSEGSHEIAYELIAPTAESLQRPPTVYVAASFADPAQRWLARTASRGIDDIGGRSFYPLRDIGPSRDAQWTANADLDALASSDAVLVLADTAHAGPPFEVGWATHAGIPIVAFTADTNATRFTMMRGTGARIVHDLSSAVYHAVWAGIARRAGQST